MKSTFAEKNKEKVEEVWDLIIDEVFAFK